MPAKLNIYFKVWKIYFRNLALSFFSIKFYEDVYRNFHGFGLKHLLVCCGLASIINSAILFTHFQQIATYLKYDQKNRYSNYLNAIFTQLPVIKYNGQHIELENISDSIFYIKNPENSQNLLMIDLNNKIAIPNKAPIVLLKENLIINLKDTYFSFPYNKIDAKPRIIDGQFLKEFFNGQIEAVKHYFLYNVFIVSIFLSFDNIISKYLIVIFLMSLIAKFLLKRDFQTGFRIIIFAISGISVLEILIPLRFLKYYSILTFLLTLRAIMRVEQKHLS